MEQKEIIEIIEYMEANIMKRKEEYIRKTDPNNLIKYYELAAAAQTARMIKMIIEECHEGDIGKIYADIAVRNL